MKMSSLLSRLRPEAHLPSWVGISLAVESFEETALQIVLQRLDGVVDPSI
jgi:hypothetical protein